jgi:hypothetical protein
MKKLLIVPLIFLSLFASSQIVVLGQKGRLLSIDTTTHQLSIVGNYLISSCDTCMSFDSSKVVTNIIKNATLDSFKIYKGEVLVSTLKDNTGTSVDSLKHLFIDTSSSQRNGYVLTFDSTNHKWYLSAGSGGTGGITVTSYGKNATRDSTVLVLSNGTRYAARDSVFTYWTAVTGGINYVSATPKVGINNSTPQNPLDVQGGGFIANFGGDVVYTGTGWIGVTIGESFGSSAVRRTGIVFRRTDSYGGGDLAIISKHNNAAGSAAYTDVHTAFLADGSVVINNGYNYNPFSILSAYDTSGRGFNLPVTNTSHIKATAGGLTLLSITSGGTGYTGTTFSSAVLSGGTGTGGQIAGTISGGAVTSITGFTFVGKGYSVGDVLTANFNSGTGATFSVVKTGNQGNQIFDTTSNQITTDKGNNIVSGIYVTSSASTLSLQYGNDCVFTGSTSTWTLPAVVSTVKGRQNSIIIKNRGSGTITLNSSTGSQIYTTSAQSSINIIAGAACEISPDGTYLNVMYNQ